MTNKEPLVTILVPSYNHSKYITKCIESIINQTYKNFELIVIDDGSTDNSLLILENLSHLHNFKLIKQENKGVSYTLNRCLKEFATGDYFTFCSSDDYWVKNKLEIQVNYMLENQFYPMCFGKSYLVDSENNVVGYSNFNQDSNKISFEDIFLFKAHPPVSYFFCIKIFKEVGFYEEDVLVEDFYMNLKILSKYAIGFIDEYLFYYRVYNEEFKINSFLNRSYSIEKVINNYKSHLLFKKSQNLVFLHRFYNLSAFRNYKLISFMNMFKSIKLFYKILFLKGLFRFIFFYKKMSNNF